MDKENNDLVYRSWRSVGNGLKARRHLKILEIITNNLIETQDELAAALRGEGIPVTQATVSRDIKELQLVKIASTEGKYHYAMPDDAGVKTQQDRFRTLFRESLVSINFSENIIVVRTIPGTASVAAEAIDRLGWQEILGTIAGENTVFVVTKPKEAVPSIVKQLEDMIS